MRDMKMLNAEKIVAILTAISLTFLPAVPSGFAESTPVDRIDGRSVPVPVQAVTEAPAQPAPAQVVIPPNPLMNTGGISKVDSKADASEAALPPKVIQAAQANLSQEELTQFNQALQDIELNSQYSTRSGADGSKSWSWTSADENTTYILRQDRRMVSAEIPDASGEQQFQEEIFWSFEAKTEAPVSEVQENIGQITDAYVRDQAQQAFDQAVANGQQTFTKIVSGGDIIYQWNDAVDASVLHQLFLAQIPSGANWSFSTQMPLMPQELSHLEENLTDSAQRAQFDSAIQDAAPLNRENWQTLLTRTTDVNGRVDSWSWVSADGKTTYTFKLDAVSPGTPVWTFAAVIQVSTYDVKQELMSWGTTSPEYLQAFEQAVQAGAVFTETVSGNQQSYQWNLPMSGLAQYAQNLTDLGQRAQFEAALLVGRYSVQLYMVGSNSWSWTSADGKTTYTLMDDKVRELVSEGYYLEFEKWGFSAETQVSVQDIRDQLALIGSPGEQAVAEEAIADGEVFSRITTGEVVQFQWQSIRDPKLIYQLVIFEGRASLATMFNQASDVQYDAQGNVISTTYRNYDWNSLLWLQMPSYATVYPSTMKYYDAQGNLLRELIWGQYGTRSIIVYGSTSITQIPAKVEVYTLDQNLYSTLTYDARGFLVSCLVLPVFVSQLQAALPTFAVSSPVYIPGSSPSRFQINVTNPSPGAGALHQMSFNVGADGQIDFNTLQTSYDGVSFLWFDAQLLLGQLKDLRRGVNDIQTLALMSQLTIDNVDTNGTIRFILEGASYTADAALFSVVQTYLDDDGVISRAEMLSLFSRVEMDGVVSEVEFNILKMLQNNPDRYPELDYVRNLTDAVVLGSRANATYQGVSLGNLAGGSSSDRLEKLVNKWFLGMDNPLATTDYYGNPLSYQQAVGSLFVNGLSYGDIMQGQLGDCYLMAGLAEIALRAPDFITDMFIDNGDGTYTVRFFNNGVADYVTIDRQLPVNMEGYLVYANHGVASTDSNAELWTALVEKAYVQINDKWRGRRNFYDAIGGGGSEGFILNIITGIATGSVALLSENSLSSVASSWLTGALIGFASRGDAYLSDERYVVGNHWYALVDYSIATQMFTLFNPWGIGYGLLTLAWNEIQQNFLDCVVTPGAGISGETNLASASQSAAGSGSAVPQGDPFPMRSIFYVPNGSAVQPQTTSTQDTVQNVLDPITNKGKTERPGVLEKRAKNSHRRSPQFSMARSRFQDTGGSEAKYFFNEPLSYKSVLDDFLFQNFITSMSSGYQSH